MVDGCSYWATVFRFDLEGISLAGCYLVNRHVTTHPYPRRVATPARNDPYRVGFSRPRAHAGGYPIREPSSFQKFWKSRSVGPRMRVSEEEGQLWPDISGDSWFGPSPPACHQCGTISTQPGPRLEMNHVGFDR